VRPRWSRGPGSEGLPGISTLGRIMHHLRQIAYLLPFILAGLLLAGVVTAMTDGGRANWLVVAFVALLLALLLFRRTRATRVH
jgi:hydrogenase-4 membrane subunit HyfE